MSFYRRCLVLPETSKNTQKKPQPETHKKTQPLKIKIAELQLLESHPIIFSDKSLNKPFNISTEIKAFSVLNIDTGNSQQNSKLQLHLVIDKHGKIKMQGDIQLLADNRSFDLKGKVTGVDLRAVSSYIEPALGHSIKSGQLNADIKLLSKQGKMDSLLELDLRHFQLKALSDEEKEKLNKKMGLGMPLDTALNLLRDKDNSIKLKLPITGDVNNPDFDPSDAIYTATSTAITFAIINYYTPFGLVTVAQGLFDLATALRFEAVNFDAGTVILTSEHNKSLDKIAALLIERPQLHVTLCGISNNNDLGVIAPEIKQQQKDASKEFKLDAETSKKLLQIAAKRSEAAKLYLIEKSVAADRLILCEPEFEIEEIAGVKISI